ncbi:hypothetical protein [Vulgatibacter sp.]|uniref:hypothetical protein n=1 Tax=Vulgatibacter sp. TaxID=1971226 RepID=UPI003562D53E
MADLGIGDLIVRMYREDPTTCLEQYVQAVRENIPGAKGSLQSVRMMLNTLRNKGRLPRIERPARASPRDRRRGEREARAPWPLDGGRRREVQRGPKGVVVGIAGWVRCLGECEDWHFSEHVRRVRFCPDCRPFTPEE